MRSASSRASRRVACPSAVWPRTERQYAIPTRMPGTRSARPWLAALASARRKSASARWDSSRSVGDHPFDLVEQGILGRSGELPGPRHDHRRLLEALFAQQRRGELGARLEARRRRREPALELGDALRARALDARGTPGEGIGASDAGATLPLDGRAPLHAPGEGDRGERQHQSAIGGQASAMPPGEAQRAVAPAAPVSEDRPPVEEPAQVGGELGRRRRSGRSAPSAAP